MRSFTTARFWELLGHLPGQVRKQAREAFRLFQQSPDHPSLCFKQVHEVKPVFSVRINRDYRAVGMRDPKDEIVWFWVGTHSEYDKLLKRL